MKQQPTTVLIGFWHEPNKDDDLPEPKVNTARRDQESVIKALRRAMANNVLVAYRGWSTCRLCGCHNGSKELQIRRNGVLYRIPEGYLHYLTEHNVGYDPNVHKALGG